MTSMCKKAVLLISILVIITVGTPDCFAFRPLEGYKIMLDPGHGGVDPGAVGPTGLKESDANLRVARYLYRLLEADGAQVVMTRYSDKFISLQDRVAKAENYCPDLFVSIHHNASLSRIEENKAEVYFNALDRGVPLRMAEEISSRLEEDGIAGSSSVIPGGFYVLRQNTAPSVLTEGGYITLPEVEKALKTGRALTNQAQAIRMAIRKAFIIPPLKVQLFAPESPIHITVPFLNLIFSSDRSISHLRVQSPGLIANELSFDKIPLFGNNYTLTNGKPLQSGDYGMRLLFFGQDGSVSKTLPVSLKIELPVENSVLLPVAPFIPEGYKGYFPVNFVIKDLYSRQNERSIVFTACYIHKTLHGATGKDGRGLVLLYLDGTEKGQVHLNVYSENKLLADYSIPVKRPNRSMVIGQLVSAKTGLGLDRVRISYGVNRSVQTGPGGFFYCESPAIFSNLRLAVAPHPGCSGFVHWIKTDPGKVIFEKIAVPSVKSGLNNRKIAISAPRKHDDLVRSIVKKLMLAGASIIRLNHPDNTDNPTHHSILHANSLRNIDFIFSFKTEPVDRLTLRHYHRSGQGSRLAYSIKNRLPASHQVDVLSGGDYEINHSGAPCIVFALPEKFQATDCTEILDAVTDGVSEVLSK